MKEGALGSFFRRMMLRIKRFLKLLKKKKEIEKELELKTKTKLELKKKNEEQIIINQFLKQSTNNKNKSNIPIKLKEKVFSDERGLKKNDSPISKDNVKPVQITVKKDKKQDKRPFKGNINDVKEENRDNIEYVRRLVIKKKNNVKLYNETYKLIEKIKDEIDLLEFKVYNIAKELPVPQKNDYYIKQLLDIEFRIDELFSIYFNIMSVDLHKIKEISKYIDNEKEISYEEYGYFENLDYYNKLSALENYVDRVKRKFNVKKEDIINNNVNDIIQIKSDTIEESKQFLDCEKDEETNTKLKKINDKISLTKDSIEENDKKINNIREDVNKLDRKITIRRYDGLINKINGNLLIMGSIPLIFLGRSLTSFLFGAFGINKGIKQIRKDINSKLGLKYKIKEKYEEKIMESMDTVKSTEYFINNSLDEIKELLYDCNHINKDEYTVLINQIKEIETNLKIQKEKIMAFEVMSKNKMEQKIKILNLKKQKKVKDR